MGFEYMELRVKLARFQRRYKRFMVDAIIEDSAEEVVAHCVNPGSMLGLCNQGQRILLEENDKPSRKLRYSWIALQQDDLSFVGVSTHIPNTIVKEALNAREIEMLSMYSNIKSEVRCASGNNASRIDFCLSDSKLPNCYVEVKNVNLMRKHGIAEFPDSVTSRGTRHLHALVEMVQNGYRAVILYLVQREDCKIFSCAHDIDKIYGDTLKYALENGVEIYALSCNFNLYDKYLFTIQIENQLQVIL